MGERFSLTKYDEAKQSERGATSGTAMVNREKVTRLCEQIEARRTKTRECTLNVHDRSLSESNDEMRSIAAVNCPCSSVVEHFLGKEEAVGSIPIMGSKVC